CSALLSLHFCELHSFPTRRSSDLAHDVSMDDFEKYLNDEDANELWELWLAASKTSYMIDQCIATTEPAYLAKHAFQLAQLFNYRSEEHTSELQSRGHLVCRLLLEK